MDLTLDRWCNAVMAWLRKRHDEAGWAALQARIARPLARRLVGGGSVDAVPRPVRMSRAEQAAAFDAYAGTSV